MGGCTYAVGGALAGGAANMMDEAAKGVGDIEGEEAAAVDAELQDGADSVKATGAGLTFFGYSLFVIAGIMIAGSVFLFQKKKAGFVLLTGVLAIGAEVGGILIIQFGVMNVIGLVAGVLAIIASRSFPSAASA
ncbi:MAG: hypothetical protein VCA36_11425 [Opitutales bacterium]